ncbi:PEP motif-containing protein, putative exosortase substrate [Citrifermentans bemidjiense Bem]|uniref:PEP motif-containing protein, putative exosortase substrate n=1 Tax=Citrifermentans bemidjiense (strain ATCC BAA-1014 / DSM 16622 / JCM 12645 / Bem) TaxID=404380 RepID=B5EG90_CITBB|nr:PEP-CTERM sorting domain-containing protein [Citrifermentans bemidjiense]ACH41003.1 PEP motif-containing protein, putative exosortase substrate [Citrifermentans bemidjiense Bem]
MKNLIRCLFLLSLLASPNPAQATMINVLQAGGTVEWSTASSGGLVASEIFAGQYNPDPLISPMGAAQFNTLVPARGGFATAVQDWIAMLEGSFTPHRYGSEIDYYNELNAMYFQNAFWGLLLWFGEENGISGGYHAPIPDFSGYDVHGLYIYNGVDFGVGTMTYDFHVFADVTPVPEPSTVFLLVMGLAGTFGLNVLREKN